MKKFFFGSRYSTALTLFIAISLVMGVVVPLADLVKFQEAGWSGVAWSVYWLALTPFTFFFLYREQRERKISTATFR